MTQWLEEGKKIHSPLAKQNRIPRHSMQEGEDSRDLTAPGPKAVPRARKRKGAEDKGPTNLYIRRPLASVKEGGGDQGGPAIKHPREEFGRGVRRLGKKGRSVKKTLIPYSAQGSRGKTSMTSRSQRTFWEKGDIWRSWGTRNSPRQKL